MFLREARSLPKRGALERCSTQIYSDPTNFRLGSKGLAGIITEAYFTAASVMKKKVL
jgi:hypothetical protein